MTDTEETKQLLDKPVVLYDNECKLCVTAHDQLRQLDTDQKLEWLDIHNESTRQRFPNVDWTRAEKEIHLIHTNGRIRTGSRAVRDITEILGGEVGRSAAKILDLPGIRDVSDVIYQIVSENRHRLGKVNAKSGS